MRAPPIVWLSLAFEALLVLVALGLGALGDAPPFADLTFSASDWAVGLVGTLPLAAFLCWSLRTRWPLLIRFRTAVLKIVVPVFRGCSPVHLAVIALAAGIGEEALFRGTLQPLGAHVLPAPVSLVAVSILFGLVHSISGLYALFAGLFGLYLGALLLLTGSLLPPIVAHSLYDFLALLALSGAKPEGRLPSTPPILHNGGDPSIASNPQESEPP